MKQFKKQITELEYRSAKPGYDKLNLIACRNRFYRADDPYCLIDGEMLIGEDAYWEFRDKTEKYDGQTYYFRNDDMEVDFEVAVRNEEFIPKAV